MLVSRSEATTAVHGDPDEGVRRLETSTGSAWITKEGILHFRSSPESVIGLAQARENVAAQLELTRGVPCYAVAYLTRLTGIDSEAREYSAEKASEMYLATALVAPNLVSRMLASLLLRVNTLSVPTRVFKAEAEAVEWLLDLRRAAIEAARIQ